MLRSAIRLAYDYPTGYPAGLPYGYPASYPASRLPVGIRIACEFGNSLSPASFPAARVFLRLLDADISEKAK
jgi:hypothetical protein